MEPDVAGILTQAGRHKRFGAPEKLWVKGGEKTAMKVEMHLVPGRGYRG